MSKYVVESTKGVGYIYTFGPRSWNVYFVKVTGKVAPNACGNFETKEAALAFVAQRNGKIVRRPAA